MGIAYLGVRVHIIFFHGCSRKRVVLYDALNFIRGKRPFIKGNDFLIAPDCRHAFVGFHFTVYIFTDDGVNGDDP